MPAAKRAQREATEDWEQLRMFVASPQQETYELLRPIVLFGRTPAERARETGVAERTLRRKADRFDATGMASLFEAAASATTDRRALPAEIRQAILALKAEYAPLRPNEIATICEQRSHLAISSATPACTSGGRKIGRQAEQFPFSLAVSHAIRPEVSCHADCTPAPHIIRRGVMGRA